MTAINVHIIFRWGTKTKSGNSIWRFKTWFKTVFQHCLLHYTSWKKPGLLEGLTSARIFILRATTENDSASPLSPRLKRAKPSQTSTLDSHGFNTQGSFVKTVVMSCLQEMLNPPLESCKFFNITLRTDCFQISREGYNNEVGMTDGRNLPGFFWTAKGTRDSFWSLENRYAFPLAAYITRHVWVPYIERPNQVRWEDFVLTAARVVNRFWKRSFNDCFLVR